MSLSSAHSPRGFPLVRSLPGAVDAIFCERSRIESGNALYVSSVVCSERLFFVLNVGMTSTERKTANNGPVLCVIRPQSDTTTIVFETDYSACTKQPCSLGRFQRTQGYQRAARMPKLAQAAIARRPPFFPSPSSPRISRIEQPACFA